MIFTILVFLVTFLSLSPNASSVSRHKTSRSVRRHTFRCSSLHYLEMSTTPALAETSRRDLSLHTAHVILLIDTEWTWGGNEKIRKMQSVFRPTKRRCLVIRRYLTGIETPVREIEASRVAIESPRAGWNGRKIARCRSTVSSSASSRECLATDRIGLITPPVHHLSIGTRARETRANPRPRSRAIRATETAAMWKEEGVRDGKRIGERIRKGRGSSALWRKQLP